MIRILLVKLTSLGDLIHAMPAVTDMQNHTSNIQLDWLVDEQYQQIPSWHKFVGNTITVNLRHWRNNFSSRSIGEFMNYISKIRNCEYDLIIDAQGLLKSSILGCLFTKGESHGYADTSTKEKIASLIYDQKYHVPYEQHAVTRIRNLCSQVLNYEFDETKINYGINQNFKNNERQNYIVLIPHSSKANKSWDEKKWVQIAKLIKAEDIDVHISWGSDFEKQQAQRIAKASKTKITENLNLELTSVGQYLAQAKAVVSVDTGLSHIAAAMETINLCLCVSTDPKLTGAFGNNQHSFANANELTAKQVWDKLNKLI